MITEYNYFVLFGIILWDFLARKNITYIIQLLFRAGKTSKNNHFHFWWKVISLPNIVYAMEWGRTMYFQRKWEKNPIQNVSRRYSAVLCITSSRNLMNWNIHYNDNDCDFFCYCRNQWTSIWNFNAFSSSGCSLHNHRMLKICSQINVQYETLWGYQWCAF